MPKARAAKARAGAAKAGEATATATATATAVWTARNDAAAAVAVDALRAAAATDAGAAALLGECLLRGWGVPRIDVDAANACFLQAAKGGDTFAQGVCRRDGLGGAADADAARALLRTAAEQGNVSALAAYGDALDAQRQNNDVEVASGEEMDEEDAAEEQDEEEDEEEDEDEEMEEEGPRRRQGSRRGKRADSARPVKKSAKQASFPLVPEHPVQCWQRAAEAGHPGAMTSLAGHKAKDEAIKLLTAAARVGDAYAMRRLASRAARYGRAEGEASSNVEAWFVRAHAKGLPGLAVERAHALHAQFKSYSGTGSSTLGIIVAWFLRAAEAGDADAMHWYALCRGAGVAQRPDPAAAAVWLRRAADTGHVPAMVSWAACLRNGRGVPRDHAAALPWLRAAAENGDTEALFRLGQASFVGAGMPRDLAAAVELYRKAARLGSADACLAIGRCYIGGWGVPAPDARQGLDWIARAAAADGTLRETASKMVAVALVDMHVQGWHRSHFRGHLKFEDAAEVEADPAAMVAYGWRVANMGDENRRDWTVAARWFRRAASLGDPEGLVRLGECYEHGRGGVLADAAAARACYEEAAALGDVAARLKLVQTNAALADRWRASLPPPGAPTSATADRFGVDHPLSVANWAYHTGVNDLLGGSRNVLNSAVESLREAATLGHADAMAFLGTRLLTDGATASEGRDWLEKSAAAGAPEGMTALAAVLEDDPKQLARALALYRAAAALDHVPAMIRLGRASLGGALALPTNRVEGLGWLERAAVELNDPAAMVALAEALLVTPASTIGDASHAVTQAVGWLCRAEAHKHRGASCILGWLHLQGGAAGLDRDLHKANELLDHAVRGQFKQEPLDSTVLSEAATLLGVIAQYGLGGSSPDSDENVLRWYKTANNAYGGVSFLSVNENRAVYPLAQGKELEFGLSYGKKNPKAAFALYTRLANGDLANGDGSGPSPSSTTYDEFQARRLVAQALFCMAQCLEKGVGTRADRALAMATYERAYNAGFLLAADYRQPAETVKAAPPAKRARK